MNKKTLFTTRELCSAALGAALITICTWISIPAVIPFTLQTFAIFLVTGLLGLKGGMLSLLVYLLLGLVGLPVFSGFRGGPGVLLGPTGGYLIGFFFTALTMGLMIRRFGRGLPILILSMLVGLALCYTFGSVWYLLVYTGTNAASISAVLLTCVVPFLLPDAAKILLAALLTVQLKDHIRAS